MLVLLCSLVTSLFVCATSPVAVVAYQAFVGGAAARKRAMDRPTGRVGRNRIRFFMGSVRLQWIKRVLSGDLAASVAVNTLREDMRAAVFLASTSSTLRKIPHGVDHCIPASMLA